MEGIEYDAVQITIQPGDTFVMYTDGIFEAPNADGDQFSINRVRQLTTQSQGEVTTTGKSIVDAVLKHIEGTSQEDDMCLVVVGRSS